MNATDEKEPEIPREAEKAGGEAAVEPGVPVEAGSPVEAGPLEVRCGSAGGRTVHVRGPEKLAVTKSSLKGMSTATIATWRRVGVILSHGEKTRFVVLEPAATEGRLTLGEFGVTGNFVIAEKENNPRRAREAWDAFVPA